MKQQDIPPNKGGVIAIIPAAGAGVRMGREPAKQFVELDNRPLLALTLQAFQDCNSVDAIVLVVPGPYVELCRKKVVERFGFEKVQSVISGGKRRQDSVRLGLEAIRTGCGLVVIHDGVRPLVDPAFIERVVSAGKFHRAVIAALPAKETVKCVNRHRQVTRTIKREAVWWVQTPQVFRYEDIAAAHRKAFREGWDDATDDSLLIEKLGIPVTVIEGSERNIKVTTPYDLELVRCLLSHP
jgi:2-C-methyl-D-erythritol 4-phosphate cytidylyltransferase